VACRDAPCQPHCFVCVPFFREGQTTRSSSNTTQHHQQQQQNHQFLIEKK
jgi:hypothetical protein